MAALQAEECLRPPMNRANHTVTAMISSTMPAQ
jgi:hypothetical protein